MLKRLFAALLALCLALAPAAMAENDSASIPSNPKRVVDLTGHSEVLCIMGLNVVGTANARSDNPALLPSYLESELANAKVLGVSNQVYFDLEAIRALEPDFILIAPQQEEIKEKLREIAPTATVKLAMRSWKADMLSLGELFGRRAAVATWLDNYSAKSHYIGDNIKSVQGGTIRCLALMISGEQMYAFVDAGLGGILYGDLGLGRPVGMSDRMGINMTTIGFNQLSRLEMDYLFIIGTEAELKELRHKEEWMKLPVVQKNHVKELPVEPYLGMSYSCLGADMLLNEIATMFHARTTAPEATNAPQ